MFVKPNKSIFFRKLVVRYFRIEKVNKDNLDLISLFTEKIIKKDSQD